jgi:hypothetical protein
MPPDSFSHALGQLEPASRALLDLSLRRGMRPDEIAEMLGAEADSVAASRDEALRRVAAAVGMTGDGQIDEVRARLAELPAEAWLAAPANGSAPAAAEEDPEPPSGENIFTRVAAAEAAAAKAAPARPRREAEPEEPAASPSPAREDDRDRRRTLLPILLAALGVAIVAAVFISSAGDSDDGPPADSPPPAAEQPAPEPAQPDPEPVPPAQPEPPTAEVAAVADSGAEGTAQLTDGGRRLELRVRGLPDPGGDSYTVWLYDSIIDARRLGGARSGSFELSTRLPPAADRYRFVDVSLERADGNVSHSGRSVARVPLADLR